MSSAHIRANEVHKTIEPVRQPEQKPIRQQAQGPVQAMAPQVAYRRVQHDRNGLRPADLLALQRTVGNRAVQRMVAEADDEQQAETAEEDSRRTVQTKLTVGAATDVYEQGADRVAGQVITLSDAAAQRPNRTGLPDGLKSGIESLSGMSLDGVKVHYNSAQPAQLNALAYTQGTDIHVAPGQEQHLPHEAWHVVQQAQGRVKPTGQARYGVPVNADERLEWEADGIGVKAYVPQRKVSPDKMNIVGEEHYEQTRPEKAEDIRFTEKLYTEAFGGKEYWTESDPFSLGNHNLYGDDPLLRAVDASYAARDVLSSMLRGALVEYGRLKRWAREICAEAGRIEKPESQVVIKQGHDLLRIALRAELFLRNIQANVGSTPAAQPEPHRSRRGGYRQGSVPEWLVRDMTVGLNRIESDLNRLHPTRPKNVDRAEQVNAIQQERSRYMLKSALLAREKGLKGVWKVGNTHVEDILADIIALRLEFDSEKVTLTDKSDFVSAVENQYPGTYTPMK